MKFVDSKTDIAFKKIFGERCTQKHDRVENLRSEISCSKISQSKLNLKSANDFTFKKPI